MADEEVTDKDGAGEAAAGGKLKLIIIAAVSVLLLGGAGAGGYFFFMTDDPAASQMADDSEVGEGGDEEDADMPMSGGNMSGGKTTSADKSGPAVYHRLRPAFIVAFQGEKTQRYLQADVTVMSRDSDVIAAVNMHTPLIRNNLNMMIGSQDYFELQTPEGKEALRLAATQEIRRILTEEIGKPGIETVLFTSFVMQ